MEQDSDEEITLMGDVESLQSQLTDAGKPVDTSFANLFMKSVESESQLPARLKRLKVSGGRKHRAFHKFTLELRF
jgi:hypothetical protein